MLSESARVLNLRRSVLNAYVFEFFAGAGMARAGLGDSWSCAFANDFDPKKGESYRSYWGDGDLLTADVRKLTLEDLPPVTPDLVWASFPCQDLSLAGSGAGLGGERSGTFWPFWNLMKKMVGKSQAPRIIALENVTGTLTSHKGGDFAAIVDAYCDLGYRTGALIIDAEAFVPQSRPRLFFVGVSDSVSVSQNRLTALPSPVFHPGALRRAHASLSAAAKDRWIWWDVPQPETRRKRLCEILEPDDCVDRWHTQIQTDQIVAMMSTMHRLQVDRLVATPGRHVGTIYRRTRHDALGISVQRAEVRFDDIAGCLRTPVGGSSRQVIITIDDGRVKTRLISARETARLMGLPEDYQLPARYNEAYHLTGDGVVVPVVSHLNHHLLTPLAGEVDIRAAA